MTIIHLFDSSIGKYQVGNKAFNLRYLNNNNIKVPNSFVVTKQFEIEFYKHNNIRDPFYEPKRILEGEFTGKQVNELQSLLSYFNENSLLVFRSSSLNEDSEDSSFAGQYKSIIGVEQKISELIIAIKICWYEYYKSNAARSYRKMFNISSSMYIPIIIQEMCKSIVSGVAFISNGIISIESNWGFASTVVDGLITPDKTEIDNAGEITKKTSQKGVAVLYISDLDQYETGDQIWIDFNYEYYLCSLLAVDSFEQLGIYQLDEKLTGLHSLTNQEISNLTNTLKDVQACYSQDVDIEWTIDERGEVIILQARPVTKKLPDSNQELFYINDLSTVGTGIPASTGHCYGEAKIILSKNDFYKVKEGDVIICKSTNPSYIDIMRKSAGIISEEGGILSHTAIVARELGIPCLIEVSNATFRYKDNMQLSIDGYKGKISIDYDLTSKGNRNFCEPNNSIETSDMIYYLSILCIEFVGYSSLYHIEVNKFIDFIIQKVVNDSSNSRTLIIDLDLVFPSTHIHSKVVNSEKVKELFDVIETENVIW